MIQGIFCANQDSILATDDASSDELTWEAVKHLGLKVMFITADGASQNRKLFNMHHNKGRVYLQDPKYIIVMINASSTFLSTLRIL